MKKIFIITLIISSIILFPFVVLRSQRTKQILPKAEYRGSLFEKTSDVEIDYENYLKKHNQIFPDISIKIDIENYTYVKGILDDETPPSIGDFEDFYGVVKKGIKIPETGNITFTFDVAEEGYYGIELTYLNILGRRGNISRGILINGKYPFKEAYSFSLNRTWVDEFKVSDKRVSGQNDQRPKQLERLEFKTIFIEDNRGYYEEPYQFYFKKGENKITFIEQREPVVFSNITFKKINKDITYEQYKNKFKDKEVITNFYQKNAAEEPLSKSAPYLLPMAEYSSYKFSPYEKFLTKYNAIGGYNWRLSGDEITWEINVPKEGLYQLSFSYIQNFREGIVTNRKLKVNGEVPFKEAHQVKFPRSNDLTYLTVNDSDGLIYFKKGKNTITLQANIGEYGIIVKNVETVISELRKLYRDIVIRTGTNPDPNQDYLLKKTVNKLNERITNSKKILEDARNDIILISGGRTSNISEFDRIIYQLDRFLENEKNIQKNLKSFEQNIASLGTWVVTISEQPLLIDEVIIHSKDYKLPRISTNFFENIKHEFTLLFGSYYDKGDFGSSVNVDGPKISVWILTGSDQAKIIRQLIDESFVQKENINVELKLVSPSVLLPATLSGNGPDVAIGIGQKLPVNWGVRNAILNLAQFSDFNEVAKRFSESAMVPLRYKDKVFGLPDTEDFLITFMRKDILKEIGISKSPDTWDDVVDISPILQKRHFNFFLPQTQGVLNPVLYSMIIQNKGDIYDDKLEKSNLIYRKTSDAFIKYTRLYTDYEFVVESNFVNRFRSGEMPIGVSHYTTYNTLSVFAPEINGQWEYALLPGTKHDSIIDRSSASNISASVIFNNTKNKEASWKFLKWWLSKDVQTGYASGMEAILGSAARYPTSNLEAFKELPWPAVDYYVLDKQRKNSKGVPTIPGDYIVGRYIDNAFRESLNKGYNPQDSLYHYHLKINYELDRKRKEIENTYAGK